MSYSFHDLFNNFSNWIKSNEEQLKNAELSSRDVEVLFLKILNFDVSLEHKRSCILKLIDNPSIKTEHFDFFVKTLDSLKFKDKRMIFIEMTKHCDRFSEKLMKKFKKSVSYRIMMAFNSENRDLLISFSKDDNKKVRTWVLKNDYLLKDSSVLKHFENDSDETIRNDSIELKQHIDSGDMELATLLFDHNSPYPNQYGFYAYCE